MFAQILDRDLGPLASEQHRHGTPYPGVRAGNQRDLSLKLARAAIVGGIEHRLRLNLGLAPGLLLVLPGQWWRRVETRAGLDSRMRLLGRMRCVCARDLALYFSLQRN
jgi:hypothetical protein